MPTPTDQGVVLFLAKTTATTYVDRTGATRAAVAISTGYQGMNATLVPSAEFMVGRAQDLVLTVQGTLGGAGVTSFQFALLREIIDSVSGVTWRWQQVAIARLDNTGSVACAQSIAAADLVEPDGSTAADVGYGTTNHRLSGRCKIIGKYTGAGPVANGTQLIVYVSV